MKSNKAIEFRRVTPADLPALRAVYSEAVANLGPTVYTPVQVVAWKAFAGDPGFDVFILGVHTYVATIDTDIAGFCGVADDGHVASVYVKSDRCRQGIGTTLLRWVLARHPLPRSGRYYAEASTFSLPLFERCGFRRVGTEQTTRDGVAFERFLVERTACPDDRADDG